MSAPTAPLPAKSARKRVLAAVLVAIPLIVLLTPVLVYGGFTVPVAKITFGETTGSLFLSQTAGVTVERQTVYEYMFITRTSGKVRTTDTNVSPTNGIVNITIAMKLTTPSNRTVDFANIAITGSAGARSHTVYLSVEEGVGLPGSYKLDILVIASVKVGTIVDIDLRLPITVNFTVS